MIINIYFNTFCMVAVAYLNPIFISERIHSFEVYILKRCRIFGVTMKQNQIMLG